ncbi:MAG: cyclic nucleotide-binding domain-containing protein [Myxococcota bacterium]
MHARADQAAGQGDFETALGASTAILSVVPSDHRARLKVGLCLSMLGQRAASMTTLKVVAESLAHGGFMLAAIGACRDALGLDADAEDIHEVLLGIHTKIHGLEASERARVPPPVPPSTISQDVLSAYMDRPFADILQASIELGTASPVQGDAAPASAIPLFSDLSAEGFMSVVQQMAFLKLRGDHELIHEGQPGTSVYIVVSGEVRVFRGGGDAQTLAHLGGGALFGEMALMTDKPRTATVVTTQPSELFEIDARTLERLADTHPQVADDIAAFARRRLLINVMATSSLFAPLDASKRLQVLRKFEPRVVDAKTMLIERGQPSSGLFIIVEGEVEVSTLDEAEDRVVVAYLQTADIFGEIGLMEDKPATADVRASERTVVLHLPREQFKAFVAAHPEVLGVLENLSDDRSEELKQVMADGVALDADDLIIL